MPTEMIRKSFTALDGTYKVDAVKGIVTAFVNSTGIEDYQRDIMAPGCWGQVEQAFRSGHADTAVCWGHNAQDIRGKVIDLKEVMPGDPSLPEFLRNSGAGALQATVQYNLETEAGRDAFSNVKGGYIKQWSVGFYPDPDSLSYDSRGVRRCGMVSELPEVSNVLKGASPGTVTSMAKSLTDSDLTILGETVKARVLQARAIEATFMAAVPQGFKAKKPKCSTCGDSGKIMDGHRDCPDCDAAKAVCPTCNGSKTTDDGSVCPTCNGSGKAPQDTPATNQSAEDGDDKAMNIPVPVLTGEEAVHQTALVGALGTINALISQELAEGETEYGCIIELASIANRLLAWAWGEATEYGPTPLPTPYAIPDDFSAAAEAEAKDEATEDPEAKTDDLTIDPPIDAPSDALLLLALSAAKPEPAQAQPSLPTTSQSGHDRFASRLASIGRPAAR